MGAWGFNPFDCDEGLDVKERWQERVNSRNQKDCSHVVSHFFEQWGDAVKYGDSITNNEIIALTVLHFDDGLGWSHHLIELHLLRVVNNECWTVELLVTIWVIPEEESLLHTLEEILVFGCLVFGQGNSGDTHQGESFVHFSFNIN